MKFKMAFYSLGKFKNQNQIIVSQKLSTLLGELKSLVEKPIGIGPLVIFRMAFGLLLFLEGVGAIATGWVHRVFIEPEFTFSFILFFPWLQPLPGNWMVYYYLFMGIMGLFVMLGWHYRKAILIYFIMWTLAYWMQKSSYNNHYYLLILLSGLGIFLPANQFFSMDVRRGAVKETFFVPAWTRIIFMLLLFIVYSYAGIAKVQPDWLAAKPIKIWFSNKANMPVIGGLLVKNWFQYAVAYGGILFDLFFIPAVWFPKTRTLALLTAFIFHLFNSIVFQIGIFPYLMLVMCIFFFPPDQVHKFIFGKPSEIKLHDYNQGPEWRNHVVAVVFFLFFIIMIWLPLRHHRYPGNVNWTEEGHRMAWRMMLRNKVGQLSYTVELADGKTQTHFPQQELSPKQAGAVAIRPDMIWQYAQVLYKQYKDKGEDEVAVFAQSKVSLNGRPYQVFIDPSVDLAKQPWYWFRSHNWIMPYNP